MAIRIATSFQRGCPRILKVYSTITGTYFSRSVHSKTDGSIRECDVVDFDHKQRFYEALKLNEIARALLVLKLSSYDSFVKNSLSLLKFAESMLGETLFKSLMRKTIYSQFVAGEDYNEIKDSISRLKLHGIGTILCVPTEEDYTEDIQEFESREHLFNRNSDVVHKSIILTEPGTFFQVKITAICSPALLKCLSDLLHPYQTELEKPDGLDVTNLARAFDTEKYHWDLLPSLSEVQNQHLQNSLRRIDSFAKHCKERNIRLLLDAEQYYLESAIHQMILTLQSKHNRIVPWVYGTYQCYRKDTMDRIKVDLDLMSNKGFHFGSKLVRGAYRTQENQRSTELGYDYIIHDSYEDTCEAYNNITRLILNQVACSPAEVMIATHNEESIKLSTLWMNELGIGKENKKVSFAQLYGMCDQVTYALGGKGFNVYKSVPYGPISSTLAYLARRANENMDVTTRTAKERSLLWREIGYRLLPSLSEDITSSNTQAK